MRYAIVIGGEGFIGRHLTATLRTQGRRFVVVGRPKTGVMPDPGVRRVDLLDRAAMIALFTEYPGADVYYLAATTRRAATPDLSDAFDCVSTDLLPLLNTVGSAAAAPRPPRVFVRAGSIAEYGATRVACRETSVCRPTTVYGATLLAGTAYMNALAERLPFPVVTARLALTYGAGQSTAFLAARLLHDLPAGQPVRINRPDDKRSLIHVEDTVRGLLSIAEVEQPPRIVNISTDDTVSMRHLAKLALEVTGASPDLVQFGAMTGKPDILFTDPALARRRLGWTARLALLSGLARSAPQEASLSDIFLL